MLVETSMRMMVVGDGDDAARGMVLSLKRLGHQTETASGCEEALQKAPAFNPDALFIDLRMPRIDGLGMATVLRAMPAFTAMPLIALSEDSAAECCLLAKEAGFDGFLDTSWREDDLLETLARVRRIRERGRQAVERSRYFADQARLRTQSSRQQLEEYRRTRSVVRVPVSVEKSGISHCVNLPQRPAADELRRWFKEQRCRVGPVFEPAVGVYAFFVYSKRHCIRELIAKHGEYSL